MSGGLEKKGRCKSRRAGITRPGLHHRPAAPPGPHRGHVGPPLATKSIQRADEIPRGRYGGTAEGRTADRKAGSQGQGTWGTIFFSGEGGGVCLSSLCPRGSKEFLDRFFREGYRALPTWLRKRRGSSEEPSAVDLQARRLQVDGKRNPANSRAFAVQCATGHGPGSIPSRRALSPGTLGTRHQSGAGDSTGGPPRPRGRPRKEGGQAYP